MELFDILLALLLLSFWICCIIMYIKVNQLIMLISFNIMEPKSSYPKLKEKKLKYNPANLFNPYLYKNESDLDPVVPGISKIKSEKLKKTEY